MDETIEVRDERRHPLTGVIRKMLLRPVAFHAILGKICDSATAGLMLSQALYWTDHTEDGWFFKTQSEWENEVCLTRCEQETARKVLKSKKFLEEYLAGNPARLYYRVEIETLEAAIIQFAGNQQTSLRETSKLDCGKSPNKIAGNQQTIKGTETTTETTHRLPQVGESALPTRGNPNDALRLAKRVYRRHTGRSFGNPGPKRPQWDALASKHNGVLVSAVELWAKELGPRGKTLDWPLAVFLSQSEEYIEAAQEPEHSDEDDGMPTVASIRRDVERSRNEKN